MPRWPHSFLVARTDPDGPSDGWDDVHDVGEETSAGVVLTHETYLDAENRLLFVVEQAAAERGLDRLVVSQLFKGTAALERWPDLEEGTTVPAADGTGLVQAALRGELELRLRVPDRLAVDVAEGLRLWVASDVPLPATLGHARRLGLFVADGEVSSTEHWLDDPDTATAVWVDDPTLPIAHLVVAHDVRGDDPEARVGAWRIPDDAVPAVRALFTLKPQDAWFTYEYHVTGRVRPGLEAALGVGLDPGLEYWVQGCTDLDDRRVPYAPLPAAGPLR